MTGLLNPPPPAVIFPPLFRLLMNDGTGTNCKGLTASEVCLHRSPSGSSEEIERKGNFVLAYRRSPYETKNRLRA